MTQAAEIVFQAAMQLPDVDRMQLAERLLETIDDESSFDPEWEAELLKRSKELEDGTDSGIPWTELKDQP